MKLKTFTLLRHKPYLFSAIAIILASIFSSRAAYSQVDYYYGINKKGIRIGIGGGVDILHSNWSSNPPEYSGILSIDYDFNPYFSIGVEGNFGYLKGVDQDAKLAFGSTLILYTAGSVNFKVAVGQFVDYTTKNGFEDAIKRIYVGAGFGEVYSSPTVSPHTNTNIQNPFGDPGFQTGYKFNGNGAVVSTGTFPFASLNLGTNIALRGFLGIDKVDLTPNLQYNYVLSPVFDGFQPNKDTYTGYKVNGNQNYFVGSVTLRYKF